MRKSRFHYFVQWHKGADSGQHEVPEAEFIRVLGEEYYADVRMCGLIPVSFSNYGKAAAQVRSLKKGKADIVFFSCGSHLTLTFRRDPKPLGGHRTRDSRMPDPAVGRAGHGR